jgi:hypothetical protein
MTAREFAEKLTALERSKEPDPEKREEIKVSHRTVLRWLKDGKIPGAELHTIKGDVQQFWMIPPSAIKKFKRPKMGAPTKNGKK